LWEIVKEGIKIVKWLIIEENLKFWYLGGMELQFILVLDSYKQILIMKKVFGPTKHPKSARRNVFDAIGRFLKSNFLAISSSISSLTTFALHLRKKMCHVTRDQIDVTILVNESCRIRPYT